MKKIVDSGEAGNVRLTSNNKLHKFDPVGFMTYLPQFKEVSFNISVDGVEPSDEFLRDGTKWDKKQKVFDKIFTLYHPKWAGIMHVFNR